MSDPTTPRPRRLACRRCYRHKLRCARESPNAPKCARCLKLGLTCEDRLEKSMGRPRGSRYETTEASSSKRATRSTAHTATGMSAQQPLPPDTPYEMILAPELLAQPSQQIQRGPTLPQTAFEPQSQRDRRSYGADVYNVESEVVDPVHTDSSAVESLKSEEFVTAPEYLPGQRAYWSHPADLYQSVSTPVFSPTRRSTGPETTVHTPTKSMPFVLNSSESCIDVLSDLQKFLSRQQQDITRLNPLSGFDLSDYPFDKLLTPEMLQNSLGRQQTDLSTALSTMNQPPRLESSAKRILAASHLFLELVQALAHLSIRRRSYQGGSSLHITGSSNSLETSLMVISCYLRVLNLFNAVIESLTTLRQRRGSRDTQLLPPLASTSNISTAQPQFSSALPTTFETSAESVKPVVELTSYLIKAIDEGMREYLPTIRTSLPTDSARVEFGEQQTLSGSDEVTPVVEGTLRTAMDEVVVLRSKLTRSIHQSEAFQIPTV